MSHLRERKEKSCLNCNAAINGRYCSVCGQENLEPQESVWHLVMHFFNDITHFDGKFFSSLKYVVTKPGFLTSEYVMGRRMAYLNPVRFYVFTSFVFFLILFTFFVNHKAVENSIITNEDKSMTLKDSLKYVNELKAAGIDSIKIKEIADYGVDSLKLYIKKNQLDFSTVTVNDIVIKNEKEYDSLTNIGKIKQNSLAGYFTKKQLLLNKKYGNDTKKKNADLLNEALHSIPQMLFFTLPFFALALQILYIRRKEFYYVAHVIFTIHLFIFTYVDILLLNISSSISTYFHIGWIKYITIIIGLALPFYIYKAMRNFYGQSRLKTMSKIFLLLIALFIIFLFFVLILAALSFYKL